MRSYEKEAISVLRSAVFFLPRVSRPLAHVLVYVNQNENFRAVARYFSDMLHALLTP